MPESKVGLAEFDMTIRRNDYSLSHEQLEVRDLFRDFFRNECPTTRVRAAEESGIDRELWRKLVNVGAIGMGIPLQQGGSGSSLVDLVLVAEEYGIALAPAPLIEAIITVRLLSRCTSPAAEPWLVDAAAGTRIATMAMFATTRGVRQLVPAGAIADGIIGLDGDELIIVTPESALTRVKSQGSAPFAWCDLNGPNGTRTVLATGQNARYLYWLARTEWKLLMAGALVGLGQGALHMATEYAKVRYAFGAPIGSFQAVSHSLVDCAIAVEGSRHLNWKAAWYLENEPEANPAIVAMAFAYASQAATKTAIVAVHVHGGTGYMLENDVTLYFSRAKAWAVAAGDPRAELDTIADSIFSVTEMTNRMGA